MYIMILLMMTILIILLMLSMMILVGNYRLEHPQLYRRCTHKLPSAFSKD